MQSRISVFLVVAMVAVALVGLDVRDAAALEAFTYTKIADTDMSRPDGNGSFRIVGPVAIRGRTAYFAGDGGIYSRDIDGPGLIEIVVDASSEGFTDDGVGDPSPDPVGTGMAFLAKPTVGTKGVYIANGGVVTLIADKSSLIPGGIDLFTAFGTPWCWDGELVFRALGSSGQDGIYYVDTTTIPPVDVQVVADTSDAIPGGSGTFTSFGFRGAKPLAPPGVENGVVVFIGEGSGGQEGVYAAEYNEVTTDWDIRVIADLNTSVPDRTGTFSEVHHASGPEIRSGNIFFIGIAAVDGQRSIYVHDGVTLSTFVDGTAPASLPGGRAFVTIGAQGFGVSDLGLGAHPDVSFLEARLDPFPDGPIWGIWATFGGDLRRVLGHGDILPGGRAVRGRDVVGHYNTSRDGYLIGFNHNPTFRPSGPNAIWVAEADLDLDGVPDGRDLCLDSDLSPTVVIDGCDSDVENILLVDDEMFGSGCTIADFIDELAAHASNHGEFTRGVAHLTNDLKNDLKNAGIISDDEKSAIQSCAAEAGIP